MDPSPSNPFEEEKKKARDSDGASCGPVPDEFSTRRRIRSVLGETDYTRYLLLCQALVAIIILRYDNFLDRSNRLVFTERRTR